MPFPGDSGQGGFAKDLVLMPPHVLAAGSKLRITRSAERLAVKTQYPLRWCAQTRYLAGNHYLNAGLIHLQSKRAFVQRFVVKTT